MNYLEEALKILNEDIEAVKKMYPNIGDDTFSDLLNLDPTFNPDRNSVGTYTKWFLNLYNKGKLSDEDLEELPQLLSEFDDKKKWIQNKDIGQYKSIDDLKYALENTEAGEESHARKIKNVRKRIHDVDLGKDAELYYEDSEWIIIIPKTYEASCKLGQDTKWCTASKEDDRYFLDYTEEGPLFILINKNDSNKKYQFHFESNSFMDKNDYPINISEFLANYPNLNKLFGKQLFKKLYDDLNIDYDTNDDEIVSFKLSNQELFYYLEDETYREDERIDGEAAKAILEFNSDFFDPSYFDYVDLVSFYDYNSDYIIKNLKEDEYVKSSLSLKGISFDDLKSIMLNEYNSDDEDKNEYADILKECLDLAVSTGYSIGTENEAFNDIKYSLEDTMPKNTMKYEEDNTIITISLGELKKIYSETLEESNLADYEEDDLIHVIAKYIALNFKCYEPRYGWQGFDIDAYVDDFSDRLSEFD